MIADIKPGSSVQLGILRNGQKETKTVDLATYPSNQQMASIEKHNDNNFSHKAGALGLTLAPAGSVSGAGNTGVVVTDVNPAGPAAQHGFHPGDVILDVGGKAVSTPEQVGAQVAQARRQGKHAVLMRVQSNGNTHFVAVPVGNG